MTKTNAGSPKGREPYGDGGLVVVAGVTTCQGGRESRPQGEGGQVTGHTRNGRFARCETPKRCCVSCVNVSRSSHWRAVCGESRKHGSDRGPSEKDLHPQAPRRRPTGAALPSPPPCRFIPALSATPRPPAAAAPAPPTRSIASTQATPGARGRTEAPDCQRCQLYDQE
jgi:hypothetical protein